MEYIGGPADGKRKLVPLDTSTGEPPLVQTWRVPAGHPGVPAQTEYMYRLFPAPEGSSAQWHYRLGPPA